jgi:hypothetical protein
MSRCLPTLERANSITGPVVPTDWVSPSLRKKQPRSLDGRLAFSKGPNSVGVSFPSPEDENKSSFRNAVSSIQNSGRWKKSKKPAILGLYTPSVGFYNFIHFEYIGVGRSDIGAVWLFERPEALQNGLLM